MDLRGQEKRLVDKRTWFRRMSRRHERSMSDPSVLPSKKIVLFERSISIALSLVAAALVVHHMAGDSATTDEPVHIAAGVEIVRDGTGRWNPEHPPLAKALAGLALAGLDLQPAGDPIANSSHAGLLLRFLHENRTPGETILFRARLPFVALFLALLFAVRRRGRTPLRRGRGRRGTGVRRPGSEPHRACRRRPHGPRRRSLPRPVSRPPRTHPERGRPPRPDRARRALGPCVPFQVQCAAARARDSASHVRRVKRDRG